MVTGSLFEGLPPPAQPPPSAAPSSKLRPDSSAAAPSIRPAATPGKRAGPKPDTEVSKRVRFKSNEVEASEELVLGAISKIASHIGNSGKFSKASKLAVQLLHSGSVKCDTAGGFFEILRAAMRSPSQAIDAKLWSEYHALFSAVLENLKCFSPDQQAQIAVWEFWAVLANEFRTDDTFVFSKASARLRESISALPEANEEDSYMLEEDNGNNKEQSGVAASERGANNILLEVGSDRGVSESNEIVENDPFGLNALMPRLSKKEEKALRKKNEEAANILACKETARLLMERRQAIIACLKLAADQYKAQWAQTIIDILVKHAFDNSTKFPLPQRHVIGKLWGSIREQLMHRKQGKSTSGKLDVTPFEHLQSQYAREHISIRRAVGSSGERSAEQWLG